MCNISYYIPNLIPSVSVTFVFYFLTSALNTSLHSPQLSLSYLGFSSPSLNFCGQVQAGNSMNLNFH